MTTQDVLQNLEAHATDQNRKVYARHGARNHLGVSYAHMKALKKQIKTNHALAQDLWQSGVHEARIVATYIASPQKIDDNLLESWMSDIDNYVLADAFSSLAAKSRLSYEKMMRWIRSDHEWVGRVGWSLMASHAMKDKSLTDGFFEQQIATIEAEIHGRKNRVRDAMNMALIAIGMRNATLEAQALEAAARIGKVDVDHGETNCKTPDAVAYIRKANARKKKR